MKERKKCMETLGFEIINSNGVAIGGWCELKEGHKGQHEHTFKVRW
ncbi:MAG: hypothetical protein AABY10_02790 [Nanoarchaeota archaeon]